MRKALPIVLVLAVAAFLLLFRLGAPPLDEGEARSARLASDIGAGECLFPPHSKRSEAGGPPLVYWRLLPFAWVACGASELVVRLPSVAWAVALLFFTWDIARRWHDGLTAVLAAGALATSYGFVLFGRRALVDMAQAATIVWCLWYFARHRGDAGRRWLYVLGLLVGFAAGFGAVEAYGAVVVGAVVLSAAARDWAWLRPFKAVAGAVALSLVVFLVLPLVGSASTGSAEPLRQVWRQHVARHLQPLGQAYPLHRDLLGLLGLCAPWVVLVPIALAHGLGRRARREQGLPPALLLAGALAVWLALSSSREPRHFLPVVPFASIVAGSLLAQFSRKEVGLLASGAVQAVLVFAGVAVIAVLICGVVWVGPGWGWAAFVALWLAGVALMAAAPMKSGHMVLAAAAILWIVHSSNPYLHWVRGADVRDQVAKVRALGKPVAFVGDEVPAQVVFYLNAPYHRLLDEPAAAEKWASETGGVLIVSRKQDDPSWQVVSEGRGWRALVWNPDARAIALTRDPGWLAKHPLRAIKSETLTYVFSAEALVRFNLGTVKMSLFREEAEGGRQLVIKAEGKGGVPGYPMQSTILSRLRDSDFAQLEADDHRVKPSYKRRLLRWNAEGVDYLRHEHCKLPRACRDPRHFVTRPDGTTAHCTDRHCENLGHFVWYTSESFRGPTAQGAYGIIAACYLARGFDLRPGGPPHVIRVVHNKDIWDVAMRAVDEKTVDVPAGKFACYRMGFDVTPLSAHAREEAEAFEGPFGLTGHADLYVDRETKLLVLLDGQVEMGATFKVQVMLTGREAEGTQ